jgi:hypothetical protein
LRPLFQGNAREVWAVDSVSVALAMFSPLHMQRFLPL